MDTAQRTELLQLLARESYFEREKVTLASGRSSNYYIDCKRTRYPSQGASRSSKARSAKDARTAVVDDTIMTGGSSLQAADAAREAGAKVVAPLALVDRGEGADAAFARTGPKYVYLFSAQAPRAG